MWNHGSIKQAFLNCRTFLMKNINLKHHSLPRNVENIKRNIQPTSFSPHLYPLPPLSFAFSKWAFSEKKSISVEIHPVALLLCNSKLPVISSGYVFHPFLVNAY